MPCKHLPKTDLIHRQEMRPLRHGGSHFVNAFRHGDEDDSDVVIILVAMPKCIYNMVKWHSYDKIFKRSTSASINEYKLENN